MGERVRLQTRVEDLVRLYPEAVGFLTRRGLRCVRCGEPLWCTLGELLAEEGVANPGAFLAELNEFLRIAYNDDKRGRGDKRPKGGHS
jgi:hypothetical protein